MHIFALRLAVTSADDACNGPSSWAGSQLGGGSTLDGSVDSGVSAGSSVDGSSISGVGASTSVGGSTGSDVGASADSTSASNGACSSPNARIQPPAGAIVVDATGVYNGSYPTVAEGVANIPNTTDEHTLFVFPGVYEEQVKVPKFNGPLVLQGYTCNTMEYAENQVTITHKMAQKDLPANITAARNELVSTLVFKSKNGVKVYNLNVANPEGNCGRGNELYARSYISGAVDFIFGQRSKSWFESCDLESVGYGCVTANGNTNSSNLSEFVFNNARVFSSNASMNGTAYLGRPWYPYARVVFQNSELGDVINSDGWQEWNNGNDTANVYFKEFNNSGAGAATSKRVSFGGQLDASVAIADILGESYASEWWVDTKFL